MSIITVYRVEDHLTKGPYIHQAYRTPQQAKVSLALANRHSDAWFISPETTPATNPDIHPGPTDDPGMRDRWYRLTLSPISRDYNFGFPSTERLGQWFFGERDTLELLNMHVAAYEVPHQAVVRGEWQLAFRRPSAILVNTLPLAGLVE